MKSITINGDQIMTLRDVHTKLAKELDFGPYYGNNSDALFDVLTTGVERPFSITWVNANKSRVMFGSDFETLIDVFKRVEKYDHDALWLDKFSFTLIE